MSAWADENKLEAEKGFNDEFEVITMKRRGAPRNCLRPQGAGGSATGSSTTVVLSISPDTGGRPRGLWDRWCGPQLWPDCIDAQDSPALSEILPNDARITTIVTLT
ncbi:hypothetical protein GCM10027038_15300 [Arthrobacter bambusae]